MSAVARSSALHLTWFVATICSTLPDPVDPAPVCARPASVDNMASLLLSLSAGPAQPVKHDNGKRFACTAPRSHPAVGPGCRRLLPPPLLPRSERAWAVACAGFAGTSRGSAEADRSGGGERWDDWGAPRRRRDSERGRSGERGDAGSGRRRSRGGERSGNRQGSEGAGTAPQRPRADQGSNGGGRPDAQDAQPMDDLERWVPAQLR